MTKPTGGPEKKTDSKPQQAPQQHSHAPTQTLPTRKGHQPLPDQCHAVGCKGKPKHFNFCDEHYEHFKFGLIKKTGEQVSDYEKKIEHYNAYVAKRGARKVA